MKISYNWLKKHFETTLSAEKVADHLTQSGLEVEGIEHFESVRGGLKGVVVGEVLSCEKHPDADKLSLTTVDYGAEETVPVVCGAPNVAAGQKVLFAPVGTTLYPAGHDPLKIKKAKIRGQVSLGMICAEDELGMGSSHDGIVELDTKAPNGTAATEVVHVEEDIVFEIGLTPNRADAASHRGVARDLRALFEQPLSSLQDVTLPKIGTQKINVSIKNSDACHRYCGITVEGVKVTSSPQWLQDKLKAIGLEPVNNIVDATNYVLHDLGQPLHAFDLSKISTGKIEVKTLATGTKFTTLDEVERELHADDLMICNGDEPLCIAGVFGGMDSGVTEKTSAIFLESAYFLPDGVRRTSMRHGLKTDASFRFERGTDPELPLLALKQAVELIQEIAGGEVTSDIVDVVNGEIKPFTFYVNYPRIVQLIGVDPGIEKAKEILLNLDIQIIDIQGADWKLQVPPYRVDVQREADIAEEILRIYGYDQVPLDTELGSKYLALQDTPPLEQLKSSASPLLEANGFYEIVTNSLTRPDYTKGFESIDNDAYVEMVNKLSEDLGVMRQTMIFSGLEILAFNVNRRQSNVKAYEYGKVYRKLSEGGYEEEQRMALFATGDEHEHSWMSEAGQVDFFTLMKPFSQLLQKLGLETVTSKRFQSDIFLDGLELYVNEQHVASLGKVRRDIAAKTGLKQDVFAGEVYLEVLLPLAYPPVKYREVSKFPEVRRDLSLVLDTSVTYQDVARVAKEAEKKLVRDVNVFDVYEGDKIEQGKKAYALSFTLQDQHKTLTDKVIDKTMKRLMQVFEQQLGAHIRK